MVAERRPVHRAPACVAAWLQPALTAEDAGRRMVMMGKSWRMFSHPPIAAWMQQSFKLSRASGTMTYRGARLLPNRPRGEALWKVGTRSFLVEHRHSPAEMTLVDTDGRMLIQRQRLTG
jgi:hypothetical protein